MTAKDQVGFLGLGIMGRAMAANLAAAGHEMHVYNRSPEKAEGLTARSYRSPAEAASGRSLVFICVTDDQAVEELLFGSKGLTEADSFPELVIDLSTISPKTAKKVATQLAELNMEYLDAPVSGGDIGAKEGRLTIMCGGDAHAFTRALPYLEIIGKRIFHVGPSGAGQLTKCINQIAVAQSVSAMTEAIILAESAGLNPQKTIEVISGGAAGSWSLDNYAPRVFNNDLGPGFYAKDMLKDLRFALESAEEYACDLPVTALVERLYTDLCEFGSETLGNHGLIELYRKNKEQ